MPHSEFHLFPRLPTELRLKIWALARPTSRLIHAHILSNSRFGVATDVCFNHFHLAIIGRKPPSVLQVCRESRDLLITTYTSCFDSTRLLYPLQYQPRNWRRGGPRGGANYFRDALCHMFFPCHHEDIVSNGKRTMHCDPENDIIFLSKREWPLGSDAFLAEAAFLWAGHGWTAPRMHSVKNLAMEFEYFSNDWILGIAPEDPIFEEVKIVYVILNRKMIDGDDGWQRHLTIFMCWYRQHQINNPRGFVEERRFDWELKIVARCDGNLSDGAFEEAVSEYDIGGWKNDPHTGSWLADEESWRD